MQILKNLNTYKKYYPDYLFFEKLQEEKEAKRNAYLKKHPELLKKDEIERNKLILNSINMLDEYTQRNAEDIEVATEIIKDQAVSLSTILGTLGAYFIGKIPKVNKKIQSLTQNQPILKKFTPMLPAIVGLASSLAISIPVINWNAQKEFKAAQRGRFEAMKFLKNPNHFAILTPEQNQELNEVIKETKLEKKPIKIPKLGILSNFMMLEETEAQFELQKEELLIKREKRLEEQGIRTKRPEEVTQEKKDKKIIIQLLQKIDKEEEKSAKNIGMLSNIAHLSVIGLGFLAGWTTNYLTSNLKFFKNSNITEIIPFITGGITTVYTSLWASKIAKKTYKMEQAKIRKELLKNPENFVYVDEELYQNEKPLYEKIPPKNTMASIKQTIKEYKDYKISKAQNEENILKKKSAIEKLTLSKEQEKAAKQLKRTIFRTFNKIDDKKQSYTESVEAVAESIMLPIELGTMGLGCILMNNKNLSKKIKIPLSLTVALIPNVFLEYLMTEEQDRASKVANMLVIKELKKEENSSNPNLLVQKNEIKA